MRFSSEYPRIPSISPPSVRTHSAVSSFPSPPKWPQRSIPTRFACLSVQYSKLTAWRPASQGIRFWERGVVIHRARPAESRHTFARDSAKKGAQNRRLPNTTARREGIFAYSHGDATATMRRRDDATTRRRGRRNYRNRKLVLAQTKTHVSHASVCVPSTLQLEL